jgi:hypothetical protein
MPNFEGQIKADICREMLRWISGKIKERIRSVACRSSVGFDAGNYSRDRDEDRDCE